MPNTTTMTRVAVMTRLCTRLVIDAAIKPPVEVYATMTAAETIIAVV